MPRRIRSFCLAVLFLTAGATVALGNFMPYEVHKKTLPNGLDVIVIPTPEFKDVVTLNTMILAGSGNEVEKGRTGLAHLFEHIAFRHKFEDPAHAYSTMIDQMGAFNNAYTSFDVTYYHPETFVSNFERLAELEADRFKALDFSERIYRTEAGAVLGEYRRNASNPGLRMDEVLSDLAYGQAHGYGHTTMGYIEDVKDMPNSYKAGKAFYEAYYRPNNAIVVVTGDIDPQRAFDVIENNYGSWVARDVPKVPEPKPVKGPKRAHVAWESDVPPQIDLSYRVPAFAPGSTESSVLLLLPELVSGETSPLFQRLRYEKKVATEMYSAGSSARGFDPRLFETIVTLAKSKYDEQGNALMQEVESDMRQGLRELQSFSKRSGAAKTLEDLKSKFRYDLLARLGSPSSIANTYVNFYRFDRDKDVLDELVNGLKKLTPADVDAFANKYLVPSGEVVVTMSYKGKES